MIRVSLITIGDEVCIGQVLNTNAHWLAQQLTNIGCSVVTHSTIEDDKNQIKNEIKRLKRFSDIIIITGGLGPTHDDITKVTLAELFDDTMISHEPTLHQIEDMMKKRGVEINERLKAQALIPSRCIPLKNNVGTAPGMIFEDAGCYIISLPGVPAEMKNIFKNHILSFINVLFKERKPQLVVHKTINTVGISEAILADLIGDPKLFMPSGKLAFLPSNKGTRLRISISAPNPELAKRRIEKARVHLYNLVGKYIISEDDVSFMAKISELLTKMSKTVSVAESCTGGLLGADFTSLPGSSTHFKGGIVAYDNNIKENLLVVNKKMLENFGAVSEEVACEMAKNVRVLFKSDFGLSITGIAGPDGGTEEKPVGTIWIALADKNNVFAKKFGFSNDRTINRDRAVLNAEIMLFQKLVEIIESGKKS